jgi:hypothetical protein
VYSNLERIKFHLEVDFHALGMTNSMVEDSENQVHTTLALLYPESHQFGYLTFLGLNFLICKNQEIKPLYQYFCGLR